MEEANRVLSQEEIDTLLTSHLTSNGAESSDSNSKTATSTLEPDKIPQLLSTTNTPETVSPENTDSQNHTSNNSLEQTISELSERVNKLEQSIITLQSQYNDNSRTVNEGFNPSVEQLDEINNSLTIINEGLKCTAGYNINKTYECRHCGSTGIVAIRVRCNECGQENWWGWWPKKNK